MEMDFHPKWHDDGMDMLSYVYDMIKDYKFGWNFDEEDDEDNVVNMPRGRSATTGY
jgi:hypothetical protein